MKTQSIDLAAVDRWLENKLEDSLTELTKLVAQPSIAAQGVGREAGAKLVGSMLERRGFKVEILPTGGHPVVVAERAGAGNKTLLIYNH